ncbi:MAG: hypothetical protein GYB67_05545 [Chloroflexi bacterium]|nr:hypothetical protein [Chloroflexota bacterium]
MAKKSSKKEQPDAAATIPQQIDIGPPPPELGEGDQAPQVWRVGEFFVLFDAMAEMSRIVSVVSRTAVEHRGPLSEALAVAEALDTAETDGKPLYPRKSANLKDRAFIDRGIEVMAEWFGGADATPPDIEDIYFAARGDVINDLIKPPKKKD